MARVIDAKSIKSAQRVFEVLEYFDADHREASVMDIARRYGYPQSSASELLSCLVSLGYLRRSRRGRTYHPSIRVAMLGSWVQPRFVREGRLLPLMDTLAAQTGATAVLANNGGVLLQCVHGVTGPCGIAAPQQGDELDFLHGAEGRALLAKTRRELVRQYVHRINAETEDAARRLSFHELQPALDDIERAGHAWCSDGEVQAVAIVLPHADPEEPLSLSLRAPADWSRSELLRSMNAAVMRHFGLTSVPETAEELRQRA